MMKFDHIDLSHKYLETILCIIRQGIAKTMQLKRLTKHNNEELNTQCLVETFNGIGMNLGIGVLKECQHKLKPYREDIYFYLPNDGYTHLFYVEAKRLPKYKTENEDEYVIGTSSTGKPSGGIQRYKLKIHGNCKLQHNGMIAYVENKSMNEWLQKINDTISNEYSNTSILILKKDFANEYMSTHTYHDSIETFQMHHFWINLI